MREILSVCFKSWNKFFRQFWQVIWIGKKLDKDILITGYIHEAHMEIIKDMLLINPGSAMGANASIAILNTDEKDKLITDIDIDFINL